MEEENTISKLYKTYIHLFYKFSLKLNYVSLNIVKDEDEKCTQKNADNTCPKECKGYVIYESSEKELLDGENRVGKDML